MSDLDPTTRLNAALEGRYQIERQLGEGGMATVYLARDLKHNRNVALKVLKPELAAVVGADRFLAEIETTANLQHPNILPLFDSGEADSFLFYVMPYVEGESLRERLDREHQLPVDEAVRIASDVAEALGYAHSHGVIHRDIKPANILVQAGKPVVSDFGIALAVTAGGVGRLTETGLSLGTPHYMSPEQATGDLGVGPATDIYALGCVLYEMLVGEPPYTGSTAQAVLGKIIAGDAPSVTAERRSVPSNVDAAIRRALEKVPADRFAAAPEFARALADRTFSHGETAAGPLPGSGLWRAVALSAIVLAVIFGTTTIRLAVRPASQPPVARLEFTTPDGIRRDGGLALSNDGTKIVFRGISADGTSRLYLRELDVGDPTPIAGTEGAGSVADFSPDGTAIVFAAGADVKTVSLDGGVVTVVQDSLSTSRSGVRWGRDGMIYYTHRGGGIWRVHATGGEQEEVTRPRPGEGDQVYVDLLPDANGIIFSIFGSDVAIAAASLEDGAVHTLLRDNAPFKARYAASGHLVTLRQDGSLWATPFDADRLEVIGPSRPILEGVWVGPGLNSDFELSESGTMLYREAQGGIEEGQVVWLRRDGSVEALSDEVRGSIEAVALSPDGRRVAFDRGPVGQRDIWVYGVADSTLSRLTVESQDDFRPTWSPDGRDVGFVSRRDSVQAFYAKTWDGSGPARLVRAPGEASIVFEADWTPDARSIVYRELPSVGETRVSRAPPQPDATPSLILQDGFFNAALSLSPDGDWLAYQSNETGRSEVWVRPLAGSDGARLVSSGGGFSPVWSRDGREIFYVSADGFFMAAAVATEAEFQVGARERFASADGYATSTLIQRFDVSPDGQRLLAIRSSTDTGSRDMIVFNFFEELRRIAPSD